MPNRLHLNIQGRVQGVCYRMYTQDQARALGVRGWVRNRRDGSVELVAEGDDAALQGLLHWCWQGSPSAHVTRIDDRWQDATGEFSDFVVAPTH